MFCLYSVISDDPIPNCTHISSDMSVNCVHRQTEDFQLYDTGLVNGVTENIRTPLQSQVLTRSRILQRIVKP
ncbi:hypothetical protein TNCV_1188741 [Trichonephila clavipes]|nr:hypothetical protein TNCV_1188741 [Trichonephila clavipes]